MRSAIGGQLREIVIPGSRNSLFCSAKGTHLHIRFELHSLTATNGCFLALCMTIPSQTATIVITTNNDLRLNWSHLRRFDFLS